MSLLRAPGLREWNRQRLDMAAPERFIPQWPRDLGIFPEDELVEMARTTSRYGDAIRPISMVDPLAVTYAKCEWCLVDAPVGSAFVVGDGFGVRLDNSVRNEPGRNSGMGRSEFIVPLSPHRALLVVQGGVARAWSEQKTTLGFELVDGHDNWIPCPIVTASADVVDLVNLCAFVQSHEFVFADFDSRLEHLLADVIVTPQTRHDLGHGVPVFAPITALLQNAGLL